MKSREPLSSRACPGRALRPLLGAVLCAAMAPSAFADTSNNANAEGDVVTLDPLAVQAFDEPGGTLSSPRFTAPLIDTPQTVQVIPEDIFDQQGAQDLTDVLRNTPGISFSAGENGFAADTSNFNLRGFDTSRHIFVDGARDSGNYRRDIFDIEQVEVAKGPAADNGRGGPGGYVNLVTKTPKLEPFTAASIGYGFDEYDSDNRLRARIDVNRPLADGVALRVNVMSQEGGVPGREHARQGTLGVAPSLAFGLGSPTRVTLAYRYMEQDDLPEWGIPAAFIDGMLNYDPATREDDRDNFYGLASDYDDTRAHAATARIEHDLAPGMTISNQTRWSRTARDSRFTVPAGYDPILAEVDTSTLFYDRENSALSNITNLTFGFDTGTLRHRAVVGLELTRERSESLRFGSDDGLVTDVFAPDPFRRVGAAPADPSETSAVEVDTIALYAYDTIQISERWQVTGGLRAERYEVGIDSRTVDGDPQGPDGYAVDDTTLGGKLGLVYKPAESGTIYGAVSLSNLPPGDWLSNTDISRTGDNAFPGLTAQNSEDAKTQQAINYEVGTKWQLLDDRLFTSVALFRTERRNVAIAGADEPGGEVGLQGYGKQLIQGIELGASGRITEGWMAYGGLLFMDSERDHSAALDEGLRNARPNDFGDFDATRGDELAFTPRVTATLWTTYSFASGVTLGGGAVHVADSWIGRTDDHDRIIPNGRFGELPGYTVFNAMASWDVNPNLALRLNIDNLTDELYAVSSNWSGARVFTGASRSYLLTADMRF